MSYKKYSWSAIASDINSPFIRNHIWCSSFFKQARMLGIPRTLLGIYSVRNQIHYVSDLGTWQKAHDALRMKAEGNHRFLDELIENTNRAGEEFNSWSEKNIHRADLGEAGNGELIALLDEFCERQSEMYAYGTAIPILDFQGFAFVEGNLEKFLKGKVTEKEYGEYYKAFTEPSHNSFAQDQEEALLVLIRKYFNKGRWKSDVMKLNLAYLERDYPEFISDLGEHTEKFGWVYYAYAGPAFTREQFLEFIRGHIRNKIDPERKLKEIGKRKREILDAKKRHLKALKPDAFNEAIINLAGKVVWGKPRRKDYQSRSYYHSEKLLVEIGKRLGISLNQARSAPFDALRRGLRGAGFDGDLCNRIYEKHAVLPNDDGSISILIGKEADEFFKGVKKPVEEKAPLHSRELKGTCACGGQARGRVKIINLPSEMQKMDFGDILVSKATTPPIMTAMRKAAAIITDEGGLTCHAAIVSRELNIPCVVGTKIATAVLKDGDVVEVDASRGVIRKI
ncbi:MAG: PEP-utilizing enzyme [Candidatus Micrarchaeota archaeon]